MGVSGEFKYLGPDFSSVARVRPVKAITLPASLAIGNITRLRNLEYMAASFEARVSGSEPDAVFPFGALPSVGCSGRALDSGGPLVAERPPSARDDGDVSSCFHENKPLSRRTSSLNSPFK